MQTKLHKTALGFAGISMMAVSEDGDEWTSDKAALKRLWEGINVDSGMPVQISQCKPAEIRAYKPSE